jgi:hypothetical protein
VNGQTDGRSRKMPEGGEPIVQARERGYGTLIQVFPTYIEVKKRWGGTRTIPMRQVQGVDLNWWGSKVTIHTHEEDVELDMVEAKEVQQAILQNLA